MTEPIFANIMWFEREQKLLYYVQTNFYFLTYILLSK